MRLYLDQMFRADLAEALREAGHDVLRATEAGQARAADDQILSHAVQDNRILVTLDEHFGDWTVLPLNQHPGVLRLKIHPPTTASIVPKLLQFLEGTNEQKLRNHLVIVGPVRERWVFTSEQ